MCPLTADWSLLSVEGCCQPRQTVPEMHFFFIRFYCTTEECLSERQVSFKDVENHRPLAENDFSNWKLTDFHTYWVGNIMSIQYIPVFYLGLLTFIIFSLFSFIFRFFHTNTNSFTTIYCELVKTFFNCYCHAPYKYTLSGDKVYNSVLTSWHSLAVSLNLWSSAMCSNMKVYNLWRLLTGRNIKSSCTQTLPTIPCYLNNTCISAEP